MLLQCLIAGIVMGSCYSVVSVGMAILFQGTTVLNFGHGETVMLGAFLVFTFHNLLALNYPTAIILAILICFIIGMLMDRSVFKTIVNAPHVNVVLATCGFLYFFRGAARMIWKSEPRYPPPILDLPPIHVWGAIITSQDIFILASVFVLSAFFIWVFLFTDTGLKMRAAAQTLRGAALVGINTGKFFTIIWGVSVSAGAVAGILLGPVFSVHPDMGEAVLLRAFAAMTLGGFGNIGGAAIGGIMMGLIENLAGLYIWTPLREIIAYIVIAVILTFKPTGILGTRKI